MTSQRVIGIAFFLEMALSPVVAAIAFLAPVAAHWGAYKYVPAIVWLVAFVQCLATFRWRGLWFFLGPPVAVVAIEAFLVAAPPVARSEAWAAGIGNPNATKAGPTTSSDSVTESAMIIRNANGTFTIQKQPPKGKAEAGQEKGLIIPPQVVVPIARPANK